MRLAWHPFLAPAQVEFDHAEAARRDPRGHRIHLALAVLWCLCATGPTSVLELAGIPLIVAAVVRLPFTWRTLGSLFVQPAMLALLAFLAWQALSLAWSPDARQGLQELARSRWIWATIFLWPLAMHRGLLIAAVALGAVLGNLVQLTSALGSALHIDALHWFHRLQDRNSGWWDPVAGASMLTAVLGLHLAALVLGRSLVRALAALGVLVTILAIFATGSRGAWLASAALVGFASLVAIVRTVTRARRDPAPRSLAPLAITAALILAAAGALLVTQRDALARRFDLARQDLAAAREGHYGTDTGARLLMWIWAARAVDAHPLQGVGAGGYQAWTKSRIRALEGEPAAAAAPIHAHAHSAALHLAATTGLVGLSLAGAAAALAVLGPAVGRVRRTPAPSPPPIDPPPPASGAYAHAAPLGVLGLLLAGTFDVVQLNTQTAAVLFTLLPFCMVALPAPRPAPLRLMPRLRVL